MKQNKLKILPNFSQSTTKLLFDFVYVYPFVDYKKFSQYNNENDAIVPVFLLHLNYLTFLVKLIVYRFYKQKPKSYVKGCCLLLGKIF